MRLTRLLLIGLWLGLAGWSALAQSQVKLQVQPRVVIVSSGNTAAYSDAAQSLIAQLEQGGVSPYDIWQMNVADLLAQQTAGKLPRPRLFVALGTEASAALAIAPGGTPVLSALVPRSSFERVLRSSGRKVSAQFAAIYLDQPFARQLALVQLALPQAQRVGVLFGPDSVARAAMLRATAMAKHLTLVEASVDAPDGIFPALQLVLDSDVLLALADPQVYNSNSIQNILLSALRAKVPMVAFSPAYVRAGALLSLHTTPVQAGHQAAAWVTDLLADRPWPSAAVEPDDFEVSVNVHVARALGLSLDAPTLRLELRRLEHLP